MVVRNVRRQQKLEERERNCPMFYGLRNRCALALALLSLGGFLLFSGHITYAQAAAGRPECRPQRNRRRVSRQLGAWRDQREKEISAPDGWLTLAGLEWLKPGFNTVGSGSDSQIRLPGKAPAHLGMITVNGKPTGEDSSNAVQLLAPAGGFPADLSMDGKPAREGSLVVSNSRATTIAWHGLSLIVLKRGDRFVLRIKDADSPARAGFHGLNWYAPNPNYRVTARWVPFKPAQVEEIPTVIGTTLRLPAPGLAMFQL